jgi:CheY-like chemotaxis protein
MPQMSRVILIDWDAERAENHADLLTDAGHDVETFSKTGGGIEPLRALRDNPPDVFVIDLGRRPSHGRELGVWFRQQKATRHVPIVFVGGESDKVVRVRQVLPDAVFTEWSKIRSALSQAIKNAPKVPVVPGTFDSYSGTPLPKKLGLKPGITLALLGAPVGFEKTLGKLPDDVRISRRARVHAELAMLFVKSLADLKKRLPAAKRTMAPKGSLWIAWPKKSSEIASDLTQQTVREFGLGNGLVDYKICSIDGTWSGLRFAQRGY